MSDIYSLISPFQFYFKYAACFSIIRFLNLRFLSKLIGLHLRHNQPRYNFPVKLGQK